MRGEDLILKEEVKREYLMGSLTLKELAEQKGISYSIITKWSFQDGGWKRLKKTIRKEEMEKALQESIDQLREKLARRLEASFEDLFRLFDEIVGKSVRLAKEVSSTPDLYRLSMTLKNLSEIRLSMIKELKGEDDEKVPIQFQLPDWISERISES